MNRTLVALALLITGVPPVAYGTTVVAYVQKRGAIIAADSREIIGSVPRDDACKIAVFDGVLIFARVGVGRLAPPPGEGLPGWDAHDAASDSFKAVLAKEGASAQADFVSATAVEWNRRALKFFQPLMPAAMQWGVPQGSELSLAKGLFVGREGPVGVTAVEAIVSINMADLTLKSVTVPLKDYFVLGVDHVAMEFLKGPTKRSAELYNQWLPTVAGKIPTEKLILYITQLVKWTTQYDTSGTVGGPVDTAVLDPVGIRWTPHIKPNCKQNESIPSPTLH